MAFVLPVLLNRNGHTQLPNGDTGWEHHRALTLTHMVSPATHLGCTVEAVALSFKPVEHVTALNTVGNPNTMVNRDLH